MEISLPTNYYLKSISVTNFRAFKSINIPKLKRLNVIGGFNGSGKTSLLETIFFALDVKNPIAVVKPLLWRNLPSSGSDDIGILLKDPSGQGEIDADTRDGGLRIQIEHMYAPAAVHQSLSAKLGQNNFQSGSDIASTPKGLDLHTFLDGRREQSVFVLPENDGFAANVYKNSTRQSPNAQIMGNVVRANPSELAQRVSVVIKSRRIKELIEFVSVIQPKIQNLQVLQFNNGSNVYAEMLNGELLPVQFLGEGFQSLLSVGAGMIGVSGGLLLLDEIDHTLHHSTLSKVWSEISALAVRENCQLFVTSHSKEAIMSLAAGVFASGNEKDFQYIRLESLQDKHQAITYDMADVQSAEEYNIEIR